MPGRGNLLPGLGQAAFDELLTLRAAADQAAAEFGVVGRHDQDKSRPRRQPGHLQAALYVDLQQDGPAVQHGRADRLGRGPLMIRELGPSLAALLRESNGVS